jgi:hypothetical protein
VVRVSKLGSVMDMDILKLMTGSGWAAIGFFAARHREGDQPYLLADVRECGDCTGSESRMVD